MRTNNKSRARNKNNKSRGSFGNVVNRVFDSSGPEGKVRGTPQQIIEKYTSLARDAQLSGDRIGAENFSQHAEHYQRLLGEAQREIAERQRQQEAQKAQQPAQNQENDVIPVDDKIEKSGGAENDPFNGAMGDQNSPIEISDHLGASDMQSKDTRRISADLDDPLAAID